MKSDQDIRCDECKWWKDEERWISKEDQGRWGFCVRYAPNNPNHKSGKTKHKAEKMDYEFCGEFEIRNKK